MREWLAPRAWGMLTWLTHGELHRAPRVEQPLDQGLGQHGWREEHGPAALAVEGAHQAVGDQAEVLAEFALGVQLWEAIERADCETPACLAWAGAL